MAEAEQILANWPVWGKANADKVMSSPAWYKRVMFNHHREKMTIITDAPTDEIYLAIRLDDEEYVLGISDSAVFSDLHLVWSRRSALDANIILALIEKECGALFAMLESLTNRTVSVVGLRGSPADTDRTFFKVSEVIFSLNLSREMKLQWGDLSHLDVTHDAIRSMVRPAKVDFAAWPLSVDEVAALSEGDVIPLEAEYLNGASWSVDGVGDDAVHLMSAATTEIRFADFADETMPTITEANECELVSRNRVIASGELSNIGGVKCFKLIHLHS